MEIKEINNPDLLEKCYPVIHELRTHLSFQDFISLFQHAKSENGYTLFGLFDGESCVGLMGYRILYDFVHGKHLYVDDLIIKETHRSGGLGAQLLSYAEKLGQQQECKQLRLCTGIENEKGKRFYERLGWNLRAVAYKKPLSD